MSRKQLTDAHEPITRADVVECAVEDIRPYPDIRFEMPRRPPWRYEDTISAVDKRETAVLQRWRERVMEGSEQTPYFERNLENWRQLWRVIERSDAIVMVVDIRFPALHFVPDLYHYVTDELGKGVVLALNKCDLVPMEVLEAWKDVFKRTYPKLSFALFSSFPDAKLSASQHNSDLLSRRERRMARSKLSAWGADQLIAALRLLNLEPAKMEFLREWRNLSEETCAGDDDTGVSKRQATKMLLEDVVVAMDERSSLPQTETASEKAKNPSGKRSHALPGSSTDGSERMLRGKKLIHDRLAVGTDWSREEETTEDREDSAERGNMVTIGIVGHPNAGKSSLINGIFRKKVVSTSKTPGHTKHLQTIFVSNQVRLCDCPGLVFPGLASRELQILAGMFPIAQVRNPLSVVKYLAERVPLVEILNLDNEVEKLEDFLLETDYIHDGWTAWKICEAWAMKRGYRTARAARLDVSRAANHILRLAVEGRIVLSTVPVGYKAGFQHNPSSIESYSGDATLLQKLREGDKHTVMQDYDSGDNLTQSGDMSESVDEGAEDSDNDDNKESSFRQRANRSRFELLGEGE